MLFKFYNLNYFLIIIREGSEHDDEYKTKQDIESIEKIQEIEDSSEEDNELKGNLKKRSSI